MTLGDDSNPEGHEWPASSTGRNTIRCWQPNPWVPRIRWNLMRRAGQHNEKAHAAQD